MLAYYAATALFLLLDFAWGFNVRLAFLESLPVARAAYYGVCFACLALMLRRPAWAVFVGAFESVVTLSALIISLGMRTLLATDRVLETGGGVITIQEVFNFLISGSVAYVAWFKGMNEIKRRIGR